MIETAKFMGSTVRNRIIFWATLWLLSATVPGYSWGQGFGDPFGKMGGDQEKVTLTSSFKLKPDTRVGRISVEASIAEQHHIYSVTQAAGGPIRSQIKLKSSDQYQLTGDFTPDTPPHVDDSKAIFSVNVEHHEQQVTWSAPIKIAEGLEVEKLKIDLTYLGQACEVDASGETINCSDVKTELTAKFAGYDAQLVVPEGPTNEYKPERSHVQFSAQLVNPKGEQAAAKPGETLKLEFRVEPTDGHHIYAYSETVPEDEYQGVTLFAFSELEGWKISKATPSAQPYENQTMGYSGHKEPVTFSFDITIPNSAVIEDYELEGAIAFQSCTDSKCDAPSGLLFRLIIPVGTEPFRPQVRLVEEIENDLVKQRVKEGWGGSKLETEQVEMEARLDDQVTPEQIAEMSQLYNPASKIKYIHYEEMDSIPIGAYVEGMERQPERQTTLYMAALGMFFGGMFLNLMPCVFPVLGLKVMGFVEQSGSDPKKIRMHGIVFSLGVLVSMWVLAGAILMLKVAFKYNVSWGEQLGNPYILAGIIIVLFLMALNFAGVFEFGTSLTRVGGKVDQKTGYSSSFFTGILTTVVATPCTGPFLGTAMGFTFSQTVQVAMLLFTIFALGISFPYLVLCFFPSLINSLPRPGSWMHTFKVIMAFAMFATVAFFLQSFGAQTGVDGLTWIIMALVVIALAAFFYGTWSPAYVKPYKRMAFGWLLPALVMGVGIWMTYDASSQKNSASGNEMVDGLLWKKWYPGKIEYSLKQNPKIIWTDYTAHWCLVCKANKKAVFTNSKVQQRIKDLGVELVKVDKTSNPPEIAVDLLRSDQAAIPVNIVYPPNYPEEPAILLNGPMTHWNALKIFDRMEKIQKKMGQAVASEAVAEETATLRLGAR